MFSWFVAPTKPGRDGTVDTSSIQPGELNQAGKHSYPIVLLRVIKRQAEDLLWKGEVTQGRAALEFLKWVTGENTDPDAAAINKGTNYWTFIFKDSLFITEGSLGSKDRGPVI